MTATHRSTARRLPLSTAVLAATLALLALPLALGDRAARTSAAVPLVMIVVGMYRAAARLRRVEHADDERPPSTWSLVLEIADGAGKSLVFWAMWSAVLVLALFAPGSGPRRDVAWLGPAVAAGASLAIGYGLFSARAWLSAREGVERDAFFRSTSLAFFVTGAACTAYALFEHLAGAPRLSAAWPWNVGVLTWLVANLVYTRRAS